MKCYIEVFCRRKEIVAFDFGSFVVVIEHNKKRKENVLRVHIGENYRKHFMADPHIEMDYIESLELELGIFKRIENEGLYCSKYGVSDRLWSLLETEFDEQMGKYFGEE